MLKLETGFYTSFWDNTLEQVNKTNVTLQNPRLNVNTAIAVLTPSKTFVETKWDIFEEYEVKGAELSGCTEYTTKSQCTK